MTCLQTRLDEGAKICRSWPALSLARVPEVAMAIGLAERLREIDPNPELLAAAAPVELHDAELTAASGGHEASLVPTRRGGFFLFVDSTPTPTQRKQIGTSGLDPDSATVRSGMRGFRIVHELAHTFFYDRRTTPCRRLLARSPQEERFCDAVALTFMWPDCAHMPAELGPDPLITLIVEGP